MTKQYWKANCKAIVGTGFTFFFFTALTETFLLSREPSGWPRRGTVPGGRADCQSPFQGHPSPVLLAGLLQGSPRSRIGSCRLPGLGDDRLHPGSSQQVRRGVGGYRGDHLNQAGGNVTVGGIGEVDRVILLPYGHASRADQAGHVSICICKTIRRAEDNTARKGGLQTASATRYGRDKDLAEVFVITIL